MKLKTPALLNARQFQPPALISLTPPQKAINAWYISFQIFFHAFIRCTYKNLQWYHIIHITMQLTLIHSFISFHYLVHRTPLYNNTTDHLAIHLWLDIQAISHIFFIYSS